MRGMNLYMVEILIKMNHRKHEQDDLVCVTCTKQLKKYLMQ